MDEWFKGDKDLRAGAEEFLEILKPTPPSDRRLIIIFVKNFKRIYSEVKFTLLAIESPDKPEGFRRTGLIAHIYSYISDAKRHVATCLSDKNEEKTAENLGCALGYFLGSVEYGMVTTSFNRDADEGDIRSILNITQEIAYDLKRLNKSIKHKFLRSRLQKIAQKHGANLSDGQRKLLANIAAILR